MDTLKDKHMLETLLETGEAPWAVGRDGADVAPSRGARLG